MANTSQAERRTRLRTLRPDQPEIRLTLEHASGVPQVFLANIVDVSDGGIGVQLRTALQRGTVVTLQAHPPLRSSSARVCWCRPDFGSLFRAGLAFAAARAQTSEPVAPVGEDLYELLQVNPKAVPDTIHRVYRLLAQRYHPDNHETGNEEAFKRLTRAYETLSDPNLRAAYDFQRDQHIHARFKLFTSPDALRGKEAERGKRSGVLNVLYSQRIQAPASPSLSIFDFEDLLGVPRDHLEFTLWYLKERGYISRSDNNRFQITIAGVDYAESLESPAVAAPFVPAERLLPSA